MMLMLMMVIYFRPPGLPVQTRWRQAIGLTGGSYAAAPLSEICAIVFQLARDTA
jgi:hypothetical protein